MLRQQNSSSPHFFGGGGGGLAEGLGFGVPRASAARTTGARTLRSFIADACVVGEEKVAARSCYAFRGLPGDDGDQLQQHYDLIAPTIICRLYTPRASRREGGASAAKETLRSPTAACPDVHPHNRLMAKKALKQREARVEMPACCKEALPKQHRWLIEARLAQN